MLYTFCPKIWYFLFELIDRAFNRQENVTVDLENRKIDAIDVNISVKNVDFIGSRSHWEGEWFQYFSREQNWSRKLEICVFMQNPDLVFENRNGRSRGIWKSPEGWTVCCKNLGLDM